MKRERRFIMAMLSKVQRGYVDPLDLIGREFDTALNRFFGHHNGGTQQYAAPSYGVDIREDGDHLYVESDLPAFKKEEIDITFENQTLTIAAEHKEEKKDEKSGDWLLNERGYARFLRSFTLPATVDSQKVDAKLVDGVLKLTLNKREETKPRKIQVA